MQLAGSVTVSPGRIADIDDLIGNTVGTLLGYGVFWLLVKFPASALLVARVAWTPGVCARRNPPALGR